MAQWIGLSCAVAQAAEPQLGYVEGEVLVRFSGTAAVEASRQTAARHSLQLVRHYRGLSERFGRTCGLLRSRDKTTAALLAELNQAPWIEHVEPNSLRHRCSSQVPNDPWFQDLWGLDNRGQSVNGTSGTPGADIDFLSAVSMARVSSNEWVIAVIDTGVDYTHPDLTGNMWTNPGEVPNNALDDDGNGYVDDVFGYDFADADPDPLDVGVHGTHVAGTAAAMGWNGVGVIGVGFQGKIMALKASTDGDDLPTSALIEATEYATLMKQHGVNVVAVNASYTGPSFSLFEREAVEAAGDAGIVFCAASGNETNNNDVIPSYPASYHLSNMIVVAATDQDDQLADFSNYGPTTVDLAAPGVNILSALPVYEVNTTASVEYASNVFSANGVAYAGTTPGLTAAMYDCGLGYPSNFPPAVDGNIAFIERGTLFFSEKVANAMAAGAAAVILYNNVPGNFSGTLQTPGDWIPAVSISQEDGQVVLPFLPATGTVVNGADPAQYYQVLNGTSMATPHVAGAVVFAAMNFPTETVSQRIQRILSNATSLSNLQGVIRTGARLNLAGTVDTDGNGLPDWWEQMYFGQLTGSDPHEDSDNDHMDHLAEWRAGTNPTNALSFLYLMTVGEVVPDRFVLQWPSVQGRHYDVLRATNLSDGFTEVLSSNLPATPPINTLTGTVPAGWPAHFYRLQVDF